MFKTNKLSGFTILELIVVIAIVSILAVALIFLINPFTQIQKASDNQRKNDLALIQKALESFYADYGRYPIGDVCSAYQINDGVSSCATTYAWGSPWTQYMDKIPKDKNTAKSYIYYSDGQSYRLYASLDRKGSDLQACNAGNVCPGVPGAGTGSEVKCGGTNVCNYGVSSPNVSP